uniref:Uncharacterized protein n=1 Tax=Anopheles farauti TaxID=69004 RepID=A0A182QJF3_9DIPT
MKNRPVKHKASNAFHFKSFRERINEIDVRRGALYRVETDFELPDTEDGTFFQQALVKWSVDNLTDEYTAYQRGFKDSDTLPLLLFNKEAIVQHLIKCLQKSSDDALQPLLDLVVALAKDMRKEFRPYFVGIFEVVVQFLYSDSADRVEWTLLCLAHLFKILRGFLRSDFSLTFSHLLPLLDEKKSPSHATDFATECLGYLARDLKDKAPLVRLMLKWKMQDEAYTVPLGRLLFEILHGVQEQFHTTAKQTMQQLYTILRELDEIEADHLQDILTQTVTDIVERIREEDIKFFFDTMRTTIDGCLATDVTDEAMIVKYLTRLLQLSGIVVEHEYGRLIGESLSPLVSQLIRLLTNFSDPPIEYRETIVNHIIVLLRSRHFSLTQLEASRLTMNVLLLDNRPLYDRFIEATVHCQIFEALIWPNFMKKLEVELDEARLSFLAGLLQKKAPLCGNGTKLDGWKAFPVHVTSKGNFHNYMMQLLASCSVRKVLANFELYLSAFIVLPHLANYNEKSAANDTLLQLIKSGVKSLQNGHFVAKQGKVEQVVQLIAIAVETIVHLEEMDGKACFDLVECLLPVVTEHDCLLLNSVHLLMMYITGQRRNIITFARFKRLQPFIHPLMTSYDTTVRRLSSAIMSHFSGLPELAAGLGPLYGTIAQIELVEPQIHTYREQVVLFQHLIHDSQLCQKAAQEAGSEWTETVLRYMLSVFAVNFKLLWEPAGTVVQSYADSAIKSEEECFWNVFNEMLTMAEEHKPHAEKQFVLEENHLQGADDEANEEQEDEEDEEEDEQHTSAMVRKVMECFGTAPNIDYNNVRLQQLRMLQRCTNFCRSKGNRIVERFFAFLEQDNKKLTSEGDEDDSPPERSSELENQIKRKSSKSAGATTHQVLLCYLKILTDLPLKSVRKHADRLYATYETLVSSRHEEIQKSALNGIFVLGGAELTPYKDFIGRLTNEKTLKQALLSVFVPSEEGEEEDEGGYTSSTGRTKVAEEHRPKVVQLVLKVLDGKIKQNLGNGGSGGQHKATIVTFIGRLREEELELLLARWYEVYLRLLKHTPYETVCSLEEALDAGANPVPTPAPFKVKTLLNFLTTLQTEIAPIKPAAYAARLMHLKLCFDASLVRLDHAIYKKYKNQALLALVDIFDQYDTTYEWTDSELDAILHVYVWPQLALLPSESIHTPTPLLKLLITWSQSERFYLMLERRIPDHLRVDDEEEEEEDENKERIVTPLDAMIALLRGAKTSGAVCTRIFTALAAMLQSDDRNQSGSVDSRFRLPTDTVRPIDGRNRLLIPYVKDLLYYIRRAVKGKKMISSDLLLILTRLAESGMIGSDQKDEQLVEKDRVSLLNLLFPMLARKVHEGGDEQASEDVRRLHIIVMRLLGDISEPLQYLKQLAMSIQIVKPRGARKILLQIFESLAHHTPEMRLINTLLQGLNAMDKRWIDQPDHTIRTATFRSIDRLLSKTAPDGERMTGNVAIVFLSQAFHVLQNEKDFAARQHASEYICKVILYLATVNDCPEELQYCLDRIVLHGIAEGLKTKRAGSDRRNESIQMLGELSRTVGKPGLTTHPKCRLFAELWHFTAHGDGAERDFFENITHVQVYKHRKAMKRLAAKLADMTEVQTEGNGGKSKPELTTRSIVGFLLPIVSHYIAHDEYKKQTNLVQEASSCVINLCRLLPWRGYQSVLQEYLRKLKFNFEYQKQLLRLVIGIMDAFHFDLSAAKAVEEECGLANGTNALMNKKLMLKQETENTEAVQEEENRKEEEEEEEDPPNEDGEDTAEPKDANEDEEIVNDELEEEDESKQSQQVDKLQVARDIVHDIAKNIIPSLLSTFKFASEAPVAGAGLDKKARFAKQRVEMLKLPIAIAIVKLFMKLPRKEIEVNLPKLIIKVITFLKSRLKLARVQARNTLAHITLELGPSYLSFVLQNLLAMLTRGFQRHVLSFTVHTIIDRAQKHLSNGSVMENILQTVLHICTEDIFGQLVGIMNGSTIETGSLKKNSMPESKSCRKPYQTLYILAKTANVSMLVDLFAPFRVVLSKYRTHQTVLKVQDAFHQIAEGIVANGSIGPESLLVFIYGLISGKIFAQCAGADQQQEEPNEKEEKRIAKKLLGNVPKPGSIFIIPEEPQRYGSTSASVLLDSILTKTEGNDAAFLECGLEMLQNFIRRKEIETRNDPGQEELFPQLLDPIVPMLIDSLDSKHSKIICYTINCFASLWSTQWELQSFQQPETMASIMKSIFAILHRYNTVALDINNPNFGMVRASFRAIVAILKHTKLLYKFTDEQLRLLVMYVEQDLAVGGGRQTTAFKLLHALLARRFTFAELHTLMQKVFEMSVQSESDIVRAECRKNIVGYIMNVPLSKKVQKCLLFFVSQLQYEAMFGRESACLLLKVLFQKLPKATIDVNNAGIFFALGVRLVNEDASEIRTLVADCIETLLVRLDQPKKAELVNIIREMLEDEQLKHRELGTQLLLRIIRSEPSERFIGSWVNNVLPLLLQNLVPPTTASAQCTEGKFVKPVLQVTTLLNTDPSGDHLIIQTLNAFAELLRLYPAILTNEQYYDTVDSLAYTVQSLLNSGHQWVRHGALKLLYQIMNELDYDAIHERIRVISERRKRKRLADEDTEEQEDEDDTATTTIARQFLFQSPLRDCKTLTLDLCAQLTPNGAMVNERDDEAAGVITQLLFLIANILRVVPLDKEKTSTKKINLNWLVRRVRYVIQSEVVKTPHLYTLRKHALHWISSVIAILEQDTLEQLAPSLLIPAIRELTAQDISGTRTSNDPLKVALRKVASSVGKNICARLGAEQYDKIRSSIEESLQRKRIDRKVQLAQEKINLPIIAARRKVAKRERTKEAKKRKLQKLDDPFDLDAPSRGGVLVGMKRLSKPSGSKKGGGSAPKKRRNMERLFRD